MLEELKTLIEVFRELPDLALWAAIGFLIYKLAIIGSIFATIKFVVQKLHDVIIHKKSYTKEFKLRDEVHGIIISHDGTLLELVAQLRRLRGKKVNGGEYIHTRSVEWLREAIDAKELEDIKIENEKAREKANRNVV